MAKATVQAVPAATRMTGSCYRSGDFARIVGGDTKHRKTKPFRPQHNGKAECYQRIMTEEVLYAHEYNSENERSEAIATWNIHYNYCESWSSGRPPTNITTAHRRHQRPVLLQPVYPYLHPVVAGEGGRCWLGPAHAAQQESLLTSVVKAWAVSLRPSAMVRYGLQTLATWSVVMAASRM